MFNFVNILKTAQLCTLKGKFHGVYRLYLNFKNQIRLISTPKLQSVCLRALSVTRVAGGPTRRLNGKVAAYSWMPSNASLVFRIHVQVKGEIRF